MNRASRVKRGFFRLGLLGLVPAVIGALIAWVIQINNPSGDLYANQMPIEIGRFATKGTKEVDDTKDRMAFAELLDGGTGQDFQLIDGRTIRTYYVQPKTAEQLLQLNAEIAEFEVRQMHPISGYGSTYVASGIAFKCKGYSSCDAPFPIKAMAHLDRRGDWSIPIAILSGGAIWFVLMSVISWLIRGFMTE